ncbi:MAG: LysE family transporter [Bacteroidota bacterium]|nr:LysE family transporter [Bacteroidota bacterium]
MFEALTTLKFFTVGALFGLTAGISPGPLLTLVISETLKHSKKEGIKIAISPLITDIPIVLISFFVFSRLSQFNSILGAISILGGIFIAYLAYETLKTRELNFHLTDTYARSLKKGIIANFLSPHPYLFWITVGSPLALKAFETNLLALILFLLSFYVFLIGSKIGVAFLVSKSKVLLTNIIYLWTMRLLGIVLLLFSLLFIYEGVKYLGLV